MNIVCNVFYSQQDKVTSKFKLDTCGSSKQMAYIVKRLVQLGHKVTVVAPFPDQQTKCTMPFDGSGVDYKFVDVVPNNPMQRLDWSMRSLQEAYKDADLAICNHDFMAIPLRSLFPKLKIVQMCMVTPSEADSDLFMAAWARADVVVAQGPNMARKLRASVDTPVHIWPLAYDQSMLGYVPRERDIDALFVARCSITNYTRHLEFMQAMDHSKLRIAYTDVTGYLRKEHPGIECLDPADYMNSLRRSKVVVGLNDHWYAGYALREAVLQRCVPMVLSTACNRELVGYNWELACTMGTIAEKVQEALEAPELSTDSDPYKNAAKETYQSGWSSVEDTVCSLQ